MRKIGILLLFLFLSQTLSSSGARADSLSCRGGIISAGDRSIDVLAKCGEPASKESHQEVLGENLNDTTRQKIFITVDEWTYDFGPTQFMRIVVLKNGVVAAVRTGSYGYSRPQQPASRDCSEQIVSVGDAKFDVLARCGEPTTKDTHVEEFKERLDDNTERKVFVTVEEWTYNLGPTRFMRILTFRNGRLTNITTAGYGY